MKIDPENTTILIVEDAAVMRKIEKKTLKALGFTRVLEAEDGQVAVDLLQKGESVNLIISDWNMPNMDGYQFLQWVRSQENFKQIPFLMATGQGDKAQEEKAVEAGVSSFVAKPFNEEELRTKIDEALGLAEVPAAGGEWDQRNHLTEDGRVKLKVAHIQITDHIILGVLKHQIETGEVAPRHFVLETECMGGWNPVAESLDKGAVDAAFVLGPIAMDLFSYGTPIKLILLAHKNGSIFVRSREEEYREPYGDFFRGKKFLIPHKMSVHHMLAHLFFSRIGLNPGLENDGRTDTFFEVVAPVKMQEFLQSNSSAGGFMVAEPLGTKAIAAGAAKLQFLSSELWENHPCCVVAVRDELVEQYADAVQELTELLVQAGKFVEKKPEYAAEIAVKFLDPKKQLGLKVPILKNVLTEPKGIKTGDLFPDVESLREMHNYMRKYMGIGKAMDMERFVEQRFAQKACKDRVSGFRASVLKDSAEAVGGILNRGTEVAEDDSKVMLNLEGKYLMFNLGEQEFGIDIMKIREIVGMLPIRSIPKSPPYFKGVVDLRGKVTPVMDLKLKFGMGELASHDRNCIIVLEGDDGGRMDYGLAVDSVSEVQAIKSGDIEQTPYMGATFDTGHIRAMAKIENRVKLLLDVDRIVQAQAVAAN